MEPGRTAGDPCLHDEQLMNLVRLMTHEVRGSLVSVMAGLQVVLHGTYGAMDAAVSRKLGNLHAHLSRLLGTADDYLGLAGGSEGALFTSREALDLEDDVLAAVREELADEAERNRVLLRDGLAGMPAGTVVAANRLGMKIVFRNLIRNAVRHGGAGCTIVCGYREQPGLHRLNVFNSGTPIPADSRARLFTKFGTLDSRATSRNGGIGLGLYLTREIVRAHGGEIWYEGVPEGSDFVFTLPRTPAAGLDDGRGARA